MNGYVYAISNGRGAVKIGWTTNPSSRLAKLAALSPDSLSVVALKRGSVRDEKKAHRELAEHRIRGEWFDAQADPVKAFVSSMGTTDGCDVGPVVSSEIAVAIKEWRKRSGITQVEAGKILGVTHSAVSQIERGLIGLDARKVLIVERVAGIPRHKLRPDLYPEDATQ